jgi:hypothetical protein
MIREQGTHNRGSLSVNYEFFFIEVMTLALPENNSFDMDMLRELTQCECQKL